VSGAVSSIDRVTSFEISLPYLGSLVDDGSLTAEEPGIVTIPKDKRPPIAVPLFWFSHLGRHGPGDAGDRLVRQLAALARSAGDDAPVPVGSVSRLHSGFVAVVTAWYTAEVGRQPWVAHGRLRTADAHSQEFRVGGRLPFHRHRRQDGTPWSSFHRRAPAAILSRRAAHRIVGWLCRLAF
jgi:cytochrome bd-type quinol oxidase subunit 1